MEIDAARINLYLVYSIFFFTITNRVYSSAGWELMRTNATLDHVVRISKIGLR